MTIPPQKKMITYKVDTSIYYAILLDKILYYRRNGEMWGKTIITNGGSWSKDIPKSLIKNVVKIKI